MLHASNNEMSIPKDKTTKCQIPTSSTLRMSHEKTIELIQLYQKEECLWNPNNEYYRKLGKRHEATSRIASSLNLPNFNAKLVTIKFKNLRNSYSQELKKIASCQESGFNYHPSVFWFDQISFIEPYLNQKTPPSTSFNSIIEKNTDSYVKYRLVGGVLTQKVSHPTMRKRVTSNNKQLKTVDSASTSKTEDCEDQVIIGNEEIDHLKNVPTNLDKETDAQPEQVLRAVKVEPSGSENKPEDLLNTKRNIQDSPNTTTSKRLRKDSKSDEQNKKVDNKFENLSLNDQKNIGSFLEDLSANLRVLMSRHDDYFDDFGRYVAGRLRSLPQGKALELQPQIISLINVVGLESGNVASQDGDRDQESPLRVVKLEHENDESVLGDLND